MAHTFTSLLTHIVFSTKDRFPMVDREIREEMHRYITGIVRNLKGKMMAIDGMADHVHMLVDCPSSVSIAELVRTVKANSSKWVHQKWRDRSKFAWQTGYGAFSVSKSNVADVIQYIESQEEHHRKMSFQEEVVAFLKKHEIEYDERYIWE